METKDVESQPELFQQFDALSKGKASRGGMFYESKFKLTLKLEEMILGAIGIIAALVIVFSVGVERGRLSEYKNTLTVASPKVSVQPALQKEVPKGAVPSAPAVKHEVTIGGFMVRLATYRSSDGAGREASVLKGKGYPASFEKKGDYYLVSVGPYIKFEEAKRQLAQLKGKYQDSYIKKR